MRIRLLFTLLIITSFTFTQEFDKAKLELLFDRIEEADRAMGSLSIFKNGEEIYSRSFGYADIESKQKAHANTHYRIGSVSKTYTSTIIMMMVEEKKIKLDTKLADYFPTVPNADKITIQHLLQHRSGLVNVTSLPEYLSYNTEKKTQAEFIRMFEKNGTTFEPDEKMQYSNTNYLLLSYIIEKVDSSTYEESLIKRIIQPLNLKHTFYGKKIDINNSDANSYSRVGEWKKSSETHMSIPTGAGAIVSTPTEVNQFFHALMNGKLVSETSLELMKTMKQGYGFALTKIPFYQSTAYGHNGSIDQFFSNAGYFPKEKIGICMLTNGTNLNMNNVLIGALSVTFNRDFDVPEFKKSMTLTPTELDTYVGVYSSSDFPVKIRITRENNVLMAQAQGQSAFPLDAHGNHQFSNEIFGIDMIFKPGNDEMSFTQRGRSFTFKRE